MAAHMQGTRLFGSSAYRLAAGIAVLAGFLLVWVNLAVGIIGSEDNSANLMFVGVLAIGVIVLIEIFAAMWLLSAWLFRKAARGQALVG